MVDQIRNFTITFHGADYDGNSVKIRETLESFGGVKYLVIGRETGLLGKTFHLQCYVMLKKRISFVKAAKALPWHIENAKGTPYENFRYCSKELEFEEYGDRTLREEKYAKSVDWAKIFTMARAGDFEAIELQFPAVLIRHSKVLREVHLDHAFPDSRERTCIWLVGSPGCGKTRFANACYAPEDTFFKNPNKWFDGFKKQELLVIDDLDHAAAQRMGYYLKRWADRYPVVGEFKGGSLNLLHTAVIVTSNYRINTLYPDPELQAALHRRYKEIVVLGFQETPEGMATIKTINYEGDSLHRIKWISHHDLFKVNLE